jgi:hypothetical protein
VTDRPAAPRDFRVLTCYPNPFNSTLTVELTGTVRNGYLTVYDLMGRPVFERDFRSGRAPQSVQFDFSGKGTGTYFVRWSDQRGAEIQKVSFVR